LRNRNLLRRIRFSCRYRLRHRNRNRLWYLLVSHRYRLRHGNWLRDSLSNRNRLRR